MLRRLVSVLLLVFLFHDLVFTKESCSAMEPTPLKDVQSYKIYYDQPTVRVQQDMKNYDLVIVEPAFYTKDLVSKLQSGGTKLYAYVSVMESDTWNKERKESLQPQDFYIVDGKRVHFEKWDSYLMDLTSEHYRSVLMNDIQTQVIDKGFDGVFFDTVGDIVDQFYWKDPHQYEEQKQAFLTLLHQTTQRHKKLSKIQNWGIELFEEATFPYMDAIMWEGFEYKKVVNDDWSQSHIRNLLKLQKKHGFKVLTVSFEQHRRSAKYSKCNGFLHYSEQNNFNKW